MTAVSGASAITVGIIDGIAELTALIATVFSGALRTGFAHSRPTMPTLRSRWQRWCCCAGRYIHAASIATKTGTGID